jgi:outer membrane protein assembly factor BamB
MNTIAFVRRLTAVYLFAANFVPGFVRADSVTPQWPQFRGPGGNAIADGQSVPLEFGPGRNVRWKVAVPAGHSSPCVWGDRIFLTGHDGTTLKLLCLRRTDGKVLWERQRSIDRIPTYEHVAGDPANSTPATDGQRVVFYFDDYGVIVTDLEGAPIWEKKFPPTVNAFSYGASPVLDEGRIYLNRDGGLDSSILCLDAATGDERWVAPRPNVIASFCTPYVWSHEGTKLVLAGGTGRLEALDASSGKTVWSVKGLPAFVCPSPVAGDGMVYFGGWTTAHVAGRSRIESAFGEESGLTARELEDPKAFFERFDKNKDGRLVVDEFPVSRARDAFNFIDKNRDGFVDMAEWAPLYGEQGFAPGRNVLLAIAGGGHGDVTATHVKWEVSKGLPYVSSPLLYRGRLYLVRNGGFLSCFDARTGKPSYESERLGVPGEYYATPVAVGDHLLIAAQRGTLIVIKAGDRLDIVSRNELGEGLSATPAIVANTLYLRGDKNLWAVGN